MKKSAAPSFRSGIKRMRFLTPFLKVDIDKENEFFENLDHKTVKDSNTIQSANTTVIPTLSKSNKPSTSSSESMFQNSSTSMCVNKDTESNVRSDEEILKLISEVNEGKSNSVNAIETTSTANFLDDARTECLFEPYMFSQNINISSKLDVLNHRINEYNFEFPKESGYISESKSKIDAVLDPFQNPENIQGKGDLDFQRVSSPKSFEIDAVLDPFQNPENIEGKGDLDSQRVSSPKSFEYKIYSVLHCKRSSKKHKIWEGDGMLIVQNRSAILKDMEGKEIARAVGYKLKDTESLEEGSKFFIGGKECEIQYQMSEEEYKQNESMIVPDVESPPKTVNLHKPKFTTRRFYLPLPTLKSQEKADIKPKVFDENVLVLPHPPLEHQQIYNKKGLPVVDVCVDAFLTRQLRHHQKEGIIFMYKSILGFQHEYGHGAILADEMGLGKTLQCIALIWTLNKQGPYGGLPVLKRVIIITPCSLVNNWKNEFHKWLGKSRLQIFAIDKKHTVKEYSESPKSILIISYEMFLRSAKLLSSINFDLVVCDEGHRIKNLNIKISNVVNCLSTTRRILLTGTPIQNDLAEFFSIVDFVNPGTLGSIQCFRRTFEKPIVLSRNPECTEQEKEYGEERREELSKIANTFMLRRTHDVIHKYLPPKSETVIFCRPTNLQKNLYKHFLQSRDIEAILSENIQVDPSMHLVYISILRKLCNHPLLVYQADNMHSDISSISVLDYMKSAFSFGYNPSIQDSGKMRVLEKMLTALFSQKKRKEKIVIVSCFTQTLNIIEDMCKKKNYDILRLDGSTSASTRQEIVDIFNLSYTKFNIFLLSSKAGGVGLNLIGASRILLYDIDWNPANDLQAMSRVWRDGQKHSVYVYRLLTTGTIEEKIYQRQVSKQCLSGTVLNPSSAEKFKFSQNELKDLFTLYENTECLTHELIKCQCLISNQSTVLTERNIEDNLTSLQLAQNASMAELMNWKHIKGPLSNENVIDFCLADDHKDITFLFLNKVNS